MDDADSDDTAAVAELQSALLAAEQLLAAIDCDAVIADADALRRQLGALSLEAAATAVLKCRCMGLRLYTHALRQRLRLAAPVAASDSLVVESALRQAAQQLKLCVIPLHLLQHHLHVPVIPVRYHLHILELIAWFCTRIAAVTVEHQQRQQQQQQQQQQQGAVFTKAEAYDLLQALHRIMSDYSAESFVRSAVRASAAETDVGKLDKKLQVLRLSLLGVLSNSVIAGGAAAQGKQQLEREQRKNARSSSSRHATGNTPKAYVLLTASAFWSHNS